MIKTNESGRSMIEMLGVLAIIGVLSVGGIAGYSKAMTKYRENKTLDQISHIIANTRILFGSQANYADLGTTTNTTIINKAKLFPVEMQVAGEDNSTTYANPFSGAVTMVRSGRFTASDNKAAVLKYEGIPKEACIDLATIDWSTGAGDGVVAMGVNHAVGGLLTGGTSTAQCTGNALVCEGDGAMEVDKAVAACSSENNNYLEFKFY